jgi:hypothetical protein
MLYIPAALVAFTIFSRPFVFPEYQVEPPKIDCSRQGFNLNLLSPCNIVLTPNVVLSKTIPAMQNN